MATPFVGEIRLLPFFRGAPEGWLLCDGSLQQPAAYEALFSLIATTYGGDGSSSFGLPDLRGRVPVHQGSGTGLSPRQLGSVGGLEAVTLNAQQMGLHVHNPLASTTPAASASPSGSVLAATPSSLPFYVTAPASGDAVDFPATTLQPSGGGDQHDNTAPTLTLQYCIAWDGEYPSKS